LPDEQEFMFSAWDTINSNRRTGPRHRVRLAAGITLREIDTDESQWPSILAYTRDVSREGMALVLPSSRLGCYELSEGEHVLHIILALSPETSIKLSVLVVHCGILSEDESGAGYLVGVKFEEISAEDHILYDEFLSNLH
jgi:hypothetical protein